MATVTFYGMNEQTMRLWASQNGARLNDCDRYGTTLLVETAWSKTPSFVSWLLEKGADVKGSNSKGTTALHYTRSAEMASILLAAGVDPVAWSNAGGTPLMLLALNDGIEGMRRILQDVFSKNTMDAIDAQLNGLAKCPDGSALHAVFHYKNGDKANRARIAELLIRHGANPSLRNAKGQTPLDVLREKDATNYTAISLLEAAIAKRDDLSSKTEQEIKAWVEANRGRVNDQDESGWTLLTLSALGGSLGFVL